MPPRGMLSTTLRSVQPLSANRCQTSEAARRTFSFRAALLSRPQQRSTAWASPSLISTLHAARRRCRSRFLRSRSSRACHTMPMPSNKDSTT
eukprot:2166176-Alexandrium_andersonii.AAC.1